VKWDPSQYVRYADERERPLHDLVARIDHPAPRRVIDLGCGPGPTTVWLKSLWPGAAVEGLDSSEEMIRAAERLDAPGITFRVADATEWSVPDDSDVVVSNAVLQWIPDHQDLLTTWAGQLPAEAVFGFQVPGNFGAPSHVLMRELANSPRWRDQLDGVLRGDNWVSSAETYAELLLAAGLVVDAWETTYIHQLAGENPVLEWVRGTGLRPVLAALDAADTAEFEQSYAAMLNEAYPAGEHGTLFPFRRIFVVARRS